ncbi:YihY/virulence factor BrkB family protein [Coralloluteibacterium stylophorae]|uniref:YihY/virulence factor BrkB family protein n=1 Tax=Coralloluteibacterium stylophorae TaxID=1776034 RepID=A0A8J8AZ99_9GAMM|nr:YihY/virulence factor BrkB family protein [Coralloluteibacterium stylophorae]MBS7458055.1 YihY/virulence factor BrkB family protein [Coralloluteibacterium stylophorae]
MVQLLQRLRLRFGRLAARFQRSVAGEFVTRFGEADLLSQAAALAFYALLSMAPLVVILLWITASLYAPAQEEFFRQVQLLAGPEAGETARMVVRNAEAQPSLGSVAGWISIASLLFGASIVFAQLQTTLNRIFVAEAEEIGGAMDWLRKRLIAFGIVFSLSFLVIVSMVAQTALEVVLAGLPSLWPVATVLLSYAVYAVVFAAIYTFLPDRPVRWRLALLGGAITAALISAGRFAIGLYLGRSPLGSVYGPAGGVAIMLVWIYYSGAMFYIGALITALLQSRLRARRERASERKRRDERNAAT